MSEFGPHTKQRLFVPTTNMISLRALLPLALLVLATVFTTVVNAADPKGPKITNKVYFDIKQGDKDLGRSK